MPPEDYSPTPVVAWFVLGFALIFVGVAIFCATHSTGFLHAIGVEPRTPSTAYNFWSGFGSDMGEYTIATGLLTTSFGAYRKHNCHRHGCWRIGHFGFHDEGNNIDYLLCKHCHPAHPHRRGKKLTLEHLRELHAQQQATSTKVALPRRILPGVATKPH